MAIGHPVSVTMIVVSALAIYQVGAHATPIESGVSVRVDGGS
jgi:hypothetical protein